MPDILSIIQARRSVRALDSRPIDDRDLARILEAVRWTPSWTNSQCWELVVVKDPQVKKNLQATLPPKGNPAYNAIMAAPLVVAMCARKQASGFKHGQASTKFGDWLMFDLGLAAQSLCLMAHSLGLGTVVVGLFDQDGAARALHVPEGFELVALVPIGYPAKVPSAPKRREVAEFTHYDRW